MGRIGMPELILIALVIMLLFGANKLPEIGASIGKALKEFRKAAKEFESDSSSSEEKK